MEWQSFDKVIEVVNKSLTEKWNWFKNFKCKYIWVRVDMRDGHCLIFDRDKNYIGIEGLEYQYDEKELNNE